MDDARPTKILRPVSIGRGTSGQFRVRGCAYRIVIENVRTIAQSASVTLLAPPDLSVGVRLETPRDSIYPGESFALRYFANGGARRVIVICTAVEHGVGMVDIVRGNIIERPQPAMDHRGVDDSVRPSG